MNFQYNVHFSHCVYLIIHLRKNRYEKFQRVFLSPALIYLWIGPLGFYRWSSGPVQPCQCLEEPGWVFLHFIRRHDTDHLNFKGVS